MLPGIVRDVIVSGGVAYVADSDYGLQVIDASDPGHPTLLGAHDTPGYAYGIVVSGGVAYIADGGYGLQIIDVSDPAYPSFLGAYDTAGSERNDVAVSGDVAYVADGGYGLQIIDVSDPAHPTLLGALDTPGNARGVVMSGNVAYVADRWGGLQVIDVSDPAHPSFLGARDTPGETWGVAVSGGVAYLADSYEGLQLIDVSDPAHPTFLGAHDTPGYALSVAVSGGLACVADSHQGLQVIDVNVPAYPSFLGAYDTAGPAYGAAVSGSMAYLAVMGVQIIDVSDPAHPTFLGAYDSGRHTWGGVVVSGGVAYLANGSGGLQIIDVSDPPHPSFLGVYYTPGNARGVVVSGGVAYVANGSGGLQVIDVSDPPHPTLLGAYDTPDYAYDVAVSGGVAYVADGDSGLQVIDVSELAHPSFLGVYDTPGDARGVVVSGGVAYLADGWVGLQIIDVSDPPHPSFLGVYDTPGSADDVAVSGGVAYLADGSGLQVIDVSELAHPSFLGAYDTPHHAYDVAVSGGVAYVVDQKGGLFVLRYTGQSNTPPTITLAMPPAEGAVASGSYAIRWTDEDPDDNAQISLYYDTDNQNFDGALIVADLSEDDETDAYDWDLYAIAPGTYWIYAIIDDGHHAPVYAYSPRPLEVVSIADIASISSNPAWISGDVDSSVSLEVSVHESSIPGRVEQVTIDLSSLEGYGVADMTDPDGDGVYTYTLHGPVPVGDHTFPITIRDNDGNAYTTQVSIMVGFKWGVVQRDATKLYSLSEKLTELGVGYVRFWMGWSDVEAYMVLPALRLEDVDDTLVTHYAFPELYDTFSGEDVVWGNLDTIIEKLNNPDDIDFPGKISPVPLICDATTAPRYPDTGLRIAPFENDVPGYKGIGREAYLAHVKLFAAGAARRYSRGNRQVTLWNTENELNWTWFHASPGNWRPLDPDYTWSDTEFLTELLQAMYEGVKLGNPAALTTMNFNVNPLDANAFLNAAAAWAVVHNPVMLTSAAWHIFWREALWDTDLAADLVRWKDYVDIVGVGSYLNYFISDFVFGWLLGPSVDLCRVIARKPVMVVETGYPTHPNGDGYERWRALRKYTISLQQEYLEQSTASSFCSGAAGYFYFELADSVDPSRYDTDTEVENHFGLLWSWGEEKEDPDDGSIPFNKYQEIISNESLLEDNSPYGQARDVGTTLYSTYTTVVEGAEEAVEFFVQESASTYQLIVDWVEGLLPSRKTPALAAGTRLRIRVFRPDGSLYGEWEVTESPFELSIPNPEAGPWHVEIEALELPNADALPMIVSLESEPDSSPVVDAGPDQVAVTWTGTAWISLAGVIADPDDDTIYYEWYEEEELLASGLLDTSEGGVAAPLETDLGLGVHTLVLIANDNVNDPVWDAATVTVFSSGDVNSSGSLDAVDIQLVINAALGLSVDYDCDLNGDDWVNAIDVQLVINAALGLL